MSLTALAARWEKWSTAEADGGPMMLKRELWRRLLPHELRRGGGRRSDELLEEAEVTLRRAELWLAAARRLVETCRAGPPIHFFQQVARVGSDPPAG